ncbi:LysM peptidoglycan-binding domain-containing protein [Streptomyces sp. HUAS MG47]|uniref:transglycosylase SLT domain-containing protein n=1 Tax=Streptomyces solicamelliae TaxID=3231716 RepID=UPI0038781E40
MPASGKHRRPKRRPLRRGIAMAGTGGAALALPLIPTGAQAAAPQQAAPATTTTAATAAVEKITAALPQAAPKAAPKSYTVVRGDSLSVIAEEHRISGGWKSLYRNNKAAVGDNPSLIHPGLRLSLGKKAVAAPAKPKAPASSERASRSAERTAPAKSTPAKSAPAKTVARDAGPKAYTNTLDGWINEALDVMAEHGIPGSYEGIHRNIMRESSGNPLAINNWDSNAAKGTPSKGLLQVIDPTFRAYHVPGTSNDPYDPVANITAACNYAADRYGSIDNVFGAY